MGLSYAGTQMARLTDYDDDGDLLHRGILVVAISVIAGLLMAGMAFPVIGGIGLAAKAGATTFGKLPAELLDPPLPERSIVKAADGSTFATLYFNQYRVVVPLEQIPVVMQQAIIAIEDERFYQHHGVDLRGLARALVKNTQEGEVTQGGSTLTQQYVKNVLIGQAVDSEGVKRATERSTARKVREARYAIALEQKYTKRQILEKYLNIAYFGQGVYGVGTATNYYFNRDIRRSEADKGLTLPQAALLAGMVKNPTLYDPMKNPKTSEKRRNLVLKQMLVNNFITQQEHDEAVATPVSTAKNQRPANTCDLTTAPWFCDYLRESLLEDPAFGEDRKERAARLFQGGLTIFSTLQPKTQAGVDAALAKQLKPGDEARAAGVGVVVRPGTGEVLAIGSSLKYGSGPGKSQLNLALGGSSGFQAGSTFKVFFLAAAIKQGISTNLRLPGPSQYTTHKPELLDNGKPYTVSNYGRAGYGVLDMYRATANSVNTYYLQLEERTGLEEPVKLAAGLRVTSMGASGTPRTIPKGGSTVLGVANVSPLQMATAYAMFAARGLYCPPTAVARIIDRTGKDVIPLNDPSTRCTRMLTEDEADTVTAVLRTVVTSGSGAGAAIPNQVVAGKTGTSQNFETAWFCGFSPLLAGVTMLAHPTNPIKNPLTNFHGRNVNGGSFPATIWRDMMTVAHQGLPPVAFPLAPTAGLLEDRVAVPNVIGLSPDQATKILTDAGFSVAVSPLAVPAFVAAGLVGSTTPAPGSESSPGAVVTLYLSNGQRPTPSAVPTFSPSPAGSLTPAPTGSPSPSPSPTDGQTPKPPRTPRPPRTPTPSPTPSPTTAPSNPPA